MAMLGAKWLKAGIGGRAGSKLRSITSVIFIGTIRTFRSVAIAVRSCTSGTINSSPSTLLKQSDAVN